MQHTALIPTTNSVSTLPKASIKVDVTDVNWHILKIEKSILSIGKFKFAFCETTDLL